jgi:DivIVA domain-containing protein
VRDIEARRQGRSAPARAEIRTRVPEREVAAMQNVRFSTSVRGYDREEVHRYMLKVNTLLAELQITAAPEYAIKAALESVQEERRSVIAAAEQEAEEITRRSRSQADDRIEEAKREAEQLRNDRGRRDPHPRPSGARRRDAGEARSRRCGAGGTVPDPRRATGAKRRERRPVC